MMWLAEERKVPLAALTGYSVCARIREATIPFQFGLVGFDYYCTVLTSG
jgi:hypothetical protein